MALLSDSNIKNSSGGYSRLFQNKKLGDLISKVHSTNIKNGNELEKVILSIVKKDNRVIDNVDKFLEYNNMVEKNTRFLLSKKTLKESKKINFSKHEPDFLIFNTKNKHCYIVELKDGYNFDTKKSSGEKATLKSFESHIATKLQYETSIYVCAFNESDKHKIKLGFKGNFDDEEILTGEEFCSLLEIDYGDVIGSRGRHGEKNIEYFIEELLKIDEVRKAIEKLDKKSV